MATGLALRGERARLWVALLLAAGAALASYLALSRAPARQEGREEAMAKTATVVVAARSLPQGATLTEGDVELRQAPVEAVAEGALADVREALGRVTLYPLARGEQVLRGKLLPQGAAPGDAAAALPPGKVGMAVKVAPETAAGGLLRPGDRVDVVAALPAGTGGQEVWVACTVAREVAVLAVGQEVARPGEEGGLARGGKGDREAATVTLAASPEQALAIWAAAQRGRLTLALRGLAGETGLAPAQPAVALPADVADLCRGR